MIYENEDFKYDSETGLLYHNRNKGKVKIGTLCPQRIEKSGYLTTRNNDKLLYQHRIIWKLVYGEYPKNKIDHINGIKTDNRLCNLREVSDFDHAKNCCKRIDNISGVTGVCWNKRRGKWMAMISNNGKQIFLGNFSDFCDAVFERWCAEIQYGYSERHGR